MRTVTVTAATGEAMEAQAAVAAILVAEAIPAEAATAGQADPQNERTQLSPTQDLTEIK